jgi:hypothetical protein
MIRSVLVFLAMFSFAICDAQVKAYLGVKAGPQVASVYMDHTIQSTYITPDFIPGYTVGAIGKLFTKKRNALVNPGLQFSVLVDKKGWGQKFPETDEPKYKIQMTYVQVPVEAIINFGRGSFKSFFGIGVFVEHLIDVKKTAAPDLAAIAKQGIDFYTYEAKRDRKNGYGVRLSAGGQKDFGFGAIQLDVYATYNVSSVIDHQNFKTYIPDLSNLYTAGFSIAYMLPFGKLDY